MRWTRHDLTPGDLVLPTNAHPLQFGALTVGTRTLRYQGRPYRCDQIRAISFDWTRTEKIGVGTNHSMELQFRLPDVEHRICLYTNVVLVVYHTFRSIGQKHVALYSIYAHLSQLSFDARISEYLSRLDQNGHVTFDDCHLLPDGTLTQGKSVINLSDPLLRFENTPSHLYLWRAGDERKGLKKWILGPWSLYVALNQSIDRDVIRQMLQGMFGLAVAANKERG